MNWHFIQYDGGRWRFDSIERCDGSAPYPQTKARRSNHRQHRKHVRKMRKYCRLGGGKKDLNVVFGKEERFESVWNYLPQPERSERYRRLVLLRLARLSNGRNRILCWKTLGLRPHRREFIFRCWRRTKRKATA